MIAEISRSKIPTMPIKHCIILIDFLIDYEVLNRNPILIFDPIALMGRICIIRLIIIVEMMKVRKRVKRFITIKDRNLFA